MSEDSKPPNEEASTTDAFLSSMSFARMQRGSAGGDDIWTETNIGCDCDECGISQVPAPIQEAINRYKRQKVATGPLKRTQDRTLVKRGSQPSSVNIAVWSWALPDDAEPLLEFGKSHRLVWVKRLPGKLYSLGQGIIGSEAEEKMRKVMPWEASGIYFVPSTGGKAVGWVHKNIVEKSLDVKRSSEASKVAGGGIADLLIAKIPEDCLDAKDNNQKGKEKDDDSPWIKSLIALCRKYNAKSGNDGDGFVAISKEDAESFKKTVA
eukprot:scaffold15735_cov152-Amphora_coffeaeformis.AAC.5